MDREEHIEMVRQGPEVLLVSRDDMLALLRSAEVTGATAEESPEKLRGAIAALVRERRDVLNRAIRAEARVKVLEALLVHLRTRSKAWVSRHMGGWYAGRFARHWDEMLQRATKNPKAGGE